MFKNASLKLKLILSFALAASFSVVVGIFAYNYSNKAIEQYSSIASQNVPNLIQFIDMTAARFRMVVPVAILIETSATPEAVKKSEDDFNARYEEYIKAAKTYEDLPFADGEEAVWNKYKNGVFKQFVDMSREMIRLSGTGSKADQDKRDSL